jgi:hypothetical protein
MCRKLHRYQVKLSNVCRSRLLVMISLRFRNATTICIIPSSKIGSTLALIHSDSLKSSVEPSGFKFYVLSLMILPVFILKFLYYLQEVFKMMTSVFCDVAPFSLVQIDHIPVMLRRLVSYKLTISQ